MSKGSLVKGAVTAGDWGIKRQCAFYSNSIYSQEIPPSCLNGNPPPFTREAKSGLKKSRTIYLNSINSYEIPPSCLNEAHLPLQGRQWRRVLASLPFQYTEKRYREKPDTFVGGPEEIRTLDFYNANVALSQLSYRPVNPIIITRDG